MNVKKHKTPTNGRIGGSVVPPELKFRGWLSRAPGMASLVLRYARTQN